jgi:hypothetical protein
MGPTRTTAAVATALVLGLVAPATGLAADPSVPDSSQQLPTLRLPPGAVVRVTLLDDKDPVIGLYRATTVGAIEVESMKSAPQRVTLTVPIDRVTRLEVSPKRTTHTWTGLLVGLLAGGVATLAVASAASDSDYPALLMGTVFVPVGMGWGALVGSGVVSYHWKTIWESSSRSAP